MKRNPNPGMQRHYTLCFLALLLSVIAVTACSESVWDDLPTPISRFVAEYFPGVKIQSYSDTSNTPIVRIKGGATLKFNANYDWTSVDGNGSPLPAQLIYDQAPDALYEYLESVEQTSAVYAISRDRTSYTVLLFDSTLTYDIDSETVSYKD
ncbi:MAG: hypothetical protein NC336_03465 [Clostridium sp.]|nr:hypothetical protein [Clostridium sp.]